MKFINLTPHTVRVADANDNVIFSLDPSGAKAIARTTPDIIASIDDIPLSATKYGAISGLPDPVPDTLYIVSTLIFAHPDVAHRNDLVVPDSGPDAIRRDGQPYAVRRFTVRPGILDLL